MSRQSQAWKDLERTVAALLGGERVLRGADFSQEEVDVKIIDFPHWRIDAKYRAKSVIHSQLAEVRRKYCQGLGDVPILVTKGKGQRGEVVSMSLDDFAVIVATLRAVRPIAVVGAAS